MATLSTFAAIIAICICAILVAVIRHKHSIIVRLTDKIETCSRDLNDLKSRHEGLLKTYHTFRQLSRDFIEAQEAPATYHVRSLDAGYFAVIRRCQVRGRDYYIMIKRFTDPDTAYNLSEAEDLCDKLNEK